MHGQGQYYLVIAISPDGSTIAFTNRFDRLGLVDTKTWGDNSSDTGFGDTVWSVSFSPDSKMVATASGPAVALAGERDALNLWNTRTGALIRSIDLGIAEVSFSPDGRHLLTVNWNGTAYILRLPELLK